MTGRTQSATPHITKILLLLFGAGLSLFSAYALISRAQVCALTAQLNATAPPSDINEYVTRRIMQGEVCGLGDHLAGVAGLFIGAVIAWLAWKSLTTRRVQSNQPTAAQEPPQL